MTPLEARRLSVKDHEYVTKGSTLKFPRISSRVRVNDRARVTITDGNHVNDKIRRESSFYKNHVDNIKYLMGSNS